MKLKLDISIIRRLVFCTRDTGLLPIKTFFLEILLNNKFKNGTCTVAHSANTDNQQIKFEQT